MLMILMLMLIAALTTIAIVNLVIKIRCKLRAKELKSQLKAIQEKEKAWDERMKSLQS